MNSHKKYKCNCGRAYLAKYSLNRHKRYECGVTPQFQCIKCKRSFAYKHYLRQHMALCKGKIKFHAYC